MSLADVPTLGWILLAVAVIAGIRAAVRGARSPEAAARREAATSRAEESKAERQAKMETFHEQRAERRAAANAELAARRERIAANGGGNPLKAFRKGWEAGGRK